MRFEKNLIQIALLVCLTGCSNQNFKAEEPIDYKDNARYGFGSLIKDKDSVLRKYFTSNESQNVKTNDISVESATSNNSENKLWNAVIVALKEFPINFMDKKNGVLETEKVKVSQFDNTGSCSYIIRVKLLNQKDFTVNISSPEDSSIRLKKHEEIIREKIKKELKK